MTIKLNTMTIAERRKADLQKHYFALTKLALLCGVHAPDGKKLSSKLLRIEKEGMVQVVNRINGVITRAQFDQYEIESEFMQSPKGKYRDIGLRTDLGGHGLLAPEITGK